MCINLIICSDTLCLIVIDLSPVFFLSNKAFSIYTVYLRAMCLSLSVWPSDPLTLSASLLSDVWCLFILYVYIVSQSLSALWRCWQQPTAKTGINSGDRNEMCVSSWSIVQFEGCSEKRQSVNTKMKNSNYIYSNAALASRRLQIWCNKDHWCRTHCVLIIIS